MIRIAICDDIPEDLHHLLSMTDQYLSMNGIDACVTGFSHPDELLTSIEVERFHLYLLDIVMPMVTGLELGRRIRRFDREAQIIYATTEPQFALQAYASNPINYLIKPIGKQQLFDTLTLAISRTDLACERIFSVKTVDGLRVLNLSHIACCEYRSHSVILTVTSGGEVSSRAFRENFSNYCGPVLKDRHFLQCHASFVINMRWVERFAKDSFTLCGGKLVPIAAKRYPAVRDAYMDYLTARGGIGDTVFS